jgi:hypothetical protein
MRCMLVAKATVLLIFHAAGLIPFVLGRIVIPPLALRAFERYIISHFLLRSMCVHTVVHRELTTGIEPVTSSLPRTCSTN